MKITGESTDVLTLKDSGFLGFLVGTVFVVISALLVFAFHPWDSSQAATALIFPAVFLVIGLVLLIVTKRRVTVFDKTQNMAHFTVSGIFGSTHNQIALVDIVRIELRERRKTTLNAGNVSPKEQYRLVLVMKDGTEMFIDSMRTRNVSMTQMALDATSKFGVGREQVVGQKIASFLGVPFQNVSPTIGLPNVAQI